MSISEIWASKARGTTSALEVPRWKWKNITSDFPVGSLQSKKNHDTIWVGVDQLKKPAKFIPVQMIIIMDQMFNLYMDKIVKLHGTPISNVS